MQREDDSGYPEFAPAFFNCRTIDVYDISICMYRLCSNVEDHSNVDTSNTLSAEAVTCGTSAQLEFVKQQNLIIDMENIALKGCLESLAQEQLIKSLEQEALQREVSILRAMYQQQQQQQSQ